MADEITIESNYLSKLVGEAKRRHIFRTAGLYAGAAFVLLQLADIALPVLGIDESIITWLLLGAAAGFPATLVLVWILDLSGDREHAPGRMLDAVIVILALGVGYLYAERLLFAGDDQEVSAPQEVTVSSSRPGRLHNSIAVLPFENLSPDPNNAYFAAGVHEEILNQLAQIKDMTVLARTTMLRYADSDLTVPEIGSELNVSTVMEGSVRFAGNRVRITTQLIDTETGAHLWSEAYEEELEDIFGIQLSIARRIARTMTAEFSLEEQERIGRQATKSPVALSNYLLALSTWGNLGAATPVHEALDAAIAVDPNYAPALAFKAWIHGVEGSFGFFFTGPQFNKRDQDRFFKLAEKYAVRALDVDSNQPRAHAALANVHHFKREVALSQASNDESYRLGPNDYISANQGYIAACVRKDFDTCFEIMEHTIRLNPGDVANTWNISVLLYQFGNYEEARRKAEMVVELLPDSAQGYAPLALIHSRLGNEDLLRQYASDAEARNPTLFDYQLLALAYRNIGDSLNASRIYTLTGAGDETLIPHLGWQFWMYMAVQNYDGALSAMKRAIDSDFPVGVRAELWNTHERPDYDPIRNDPRFKNALAQVREIYRLDEG